MLQITPEVISPPTLLSSSSSLIAAEPDGDHGQPGSSGGQIMGFETRTSGMHSLTEAWSATLDAVSASTSIDCGASRVIPRPCMGSERTMSIPRFGVSLLPRWERWSCRIQCCACMCPEVSPSMPCCPPVSLDITASSMNSLSVHVAALRCLPDPLSVGRIKTAWR